jgi:hypothetical protein
MLVTRVLGDCPGCRHANAYGNVNVFGANLVRGCGYCKYSETIPLPPIRKKILYLDQFFFSHAFRGSECRFVDASERIKHVASQQLLAAPYSSLHEDETLLWSRRDELRKFIKQTSRRAKFAPAYLVERTQIIRAFQAWLAGEPAKYAIDEHDAIDRDLHQWDGYFSVDIAPFPRNIELIRDSKLQAVDALVAIFEDWRADTSTFEEDVEAEHRAAVKGFVDAYATYVARFIAGDPSAMIDSPLMSMVIETMMHCLPETAPVEDRLRNCGDFLKSDHFKHVPCQLLPARMYALLKSMVKRGAHANVEKARDRLSGFYYDVHHIATYAPYCDAIIIDQPMAEFVSHPNVALEQTFGVKVFSLQNWDALLGWLEGLEATASEAHKRALDAIYPR